MVTRVRAERKPPKTVAAGRFKAQCLALMDRVERDGTTITITKRGRPVAMLAPVRVAQSSALGFARGQIEIVGDIVSPIDVVWDATR